MQGHSGATNQFRRVDKAIIRLLTQNFDACNWTKMRFCLTKKLCIVCSICFLCSLTMPSLLPAQSGQRTDWWESTENRIRAIYERGELRSNRFGAEWLPDSSGYIVRESSENGKKPKRVIYDSASGEQRASAEDAHIASPANSMRSADARYILQYEGRNLNVRELATG